MDELLLVESVQRHDNQSAFAYLVRAHQSQVRNYLRRLCAGNVQLSEELAQETFLRAYKNIAQFRAQAKFSTWLYSIARNLYLESLRFKKPVTIGGEESVIPMTDLKLDLERALGLLTVDERDVVTICYCEEMTHEAAAEILQIPLGTLKTRLLRAKHKLSESLSHWRAG